MTPAAPARDPDDVKTIRKLRRALAAHERFVACLDAHVLGDPTIVGLDHARISRLDLALDLQSTKKRRAAKEPTR